MTALAYAYDPDESAASMPAMQRGVPKFVYDPAKGRFLQTDPVGYEDDLNLYAYVGNDPLNRTDPTGLSCADMAAQGLSGDCIDAPNYDPDVHGATRTAVSTQAIDESARANMSSLATTGDNERFAQFTETEGGVEFRERTGTTDQPSLTAERFGRDDPMRGTVSISRNADAIGHSHSDDRGDLVPGYENRNVNDLTQPLAGRPNYIYNDGTTIALEISSGQVRVRLIDGRISNDQRRDISSRLERLQGLVR